MHRGPVIQENVNHFYHDSSAVTVSYTANSVVEKRKRKKKGHLRCAQEWWTGWTGQKSSRELVFIMEVSQWFASIDSHAWPGSSANPLYTDMVHWEPCLAHSAQGRGISVGFQRKDGGRIYRVSEIIAASSSQWTRAVLICKHSGCGRTWIEHVIKICFLFASIKNVLFSFCIYWRIPGA